MYTLTICKIHTETNSFLGINYPLTIKLEGELTETLNFFGVEFEPIDIGKMKIKEIEWKNYTVFIQYLRIN